MRRKASKVLSVILLTGIVGSSLTGCGGEYKNAGRGKNGNGVSGSAVSGVSVSGSAVMEKDVKETDMDGGTEKKNNRFATDTNVYLNTENYEKDREECIQVRLDGTKRNRLFAKEEYSRIAGIADDRLYYEKQVIPRENLSDGCGICCVPIRKDKEGYDNIDESEEEMILRDGCWELIYMDEHYIFYERSSDYKIVKYDIQKKEEVCVAELSQSSDAEEIKIFAIDGYYIAVCEGSGICAQPVDGTVWYRISSAGIMEDIYEEWMAVSVKKKLCYVTQVDQGKEPLTVMATDGKKTACFISEKQLKQAVNTVLGLPLTNEWDQKKEQEVCAVTNLFSQGDRLFVQVQVNWTKDDIYHMKYMIFSCSQDETELRYEQELMDCMNTYGQEIKGKWVYETEGSYDENSDKTLLKEYALSRNASCVGMVDNAAYLHLFDYRKGVGRLACFEMETGNFYWVKKNDAAFLKLCYNDEKYESYLDAYEDRKCNYYNGFYYPENIGDGDYEFYETESK